MCDEIRVAERMSSYALGDLLVDVTFLSLKSEVKTWAMKGMTEFRQLLEIHLKP